MRTHVDALLFNMPKTENPKRAILIQRKAQRAIRGIDKVAESFKTEAQI